MVTFICVCLDSCPLFQFCLKVLLQLKLSCLGELVLSTYFVFIFDVFVEFFLNSIAIYVFFFLLIDTSLWLMKWLPVQPFLCPFFETSFVLVNQQFIGVLTEQQVHICLGILRIFLLGSQTMSLILFLFECAFDKSFLLFLIYLLYSALALVSLVNKTQSLLPSLLFKLFTAFLCSQLLLVALEFCWRSPQTLQIRTQLDFFYLQSLKLKIILTAFAFIQQTLI